MHTFKRKVSTWSQFISKKSLMYSFQLGYQVAWYDMNIFCDCWKLHIRLHEARTSFSTVPFFWFSTESQSSSRKKNMWSVWGSQTTTCWTYQDGSRPVFTYMILRLLYQVRVCYITCFCGWSLFLGWKMGWLQPHTYTYCTYAVNVDTYLHMVCLHWHPVQRHIQNIWFFKEM